jgi:hypothetical protein
VWDLSIPISVRGSSSAHLSWRGKPVGRLLKRDLSRSLWYRALPEAAHCVNSARTENCSGSGSKQSKHHLYHAHFILTQKGGLSSLFSNHYTSRHVWPPRRKPRQGAAPAHQLHLPPAPAADSLLNMALRTIKYANRRKNPGMRVPPVANWC